MDLSIKRKKIKIEDRQKMRVKRKLAYLNKFKKKVFKNILTNVFKNLFKSIFQKLFTKKNIGCSSKFKRNFRNKR